MKRICALGLAAVLLGLGHAAQASPTETGETGLVTVPTTDVLAPWRPSAGIHLNGPAGSAPGSSQNELWRTQYTFGLGLIENLEVTMQVPYLQYSRDAPARRHTDDVAGVRLAAKYRLLDENSSGWFSAALLGGVSFGSGRDSFPAILDRSSAWGRNETWELMAIADKVLFTAPSGDDAVLTLNAGGLFFDEPRRFSRMNQSPWFQRRFQAAQASFDTPFEFATAVRLPAFATETFRIQLLEEFRGNTGTIEEVDGSLPTWLFTGVRFAASNGLALQGGADFGLSGYLEPYRFIASFSYAMPEEGAPQPAPEPVARVAAAPEPLPPPQAIPAPSKRKVVLRGVKFDFAKSTLRPDSDALLDEAAASLQANPGVNIVVEGHTDSVGSNDYNMRLSIHRALAVRERLEGLGISHQRLTVRARGETEPVAPNDSETGRAENRRVELLVGQ